MSLLCNRLLTARSCSRLSLLKAVKNCMKIEVVRNFSIHPKNSSGIFKLGLVGVTIGALVGTGYSYRQLNQKSRHIINEETAIPIIEQVPTVTLSRAVKVAGDESGLKLTLYQYQTCPFCCKVRAFLDYHGISYDIVEVDPVLRQSIKWSPYKKVPILLAKVEGGYQPFNDSSMIISAIATYLKDEKQLPEIARYYPTISYAEEDGSVKKEILNKYFVMNGEVGSKNLDKTKTERQWRKWTDDVLVHTLSPNVYRTWEEALQAFNWFSDVGEWERNFPSWERTLIIYVGASAMYLIGKRLKKRYNLKDDVRQSLYDECNNWSKAIRLRGAKFMGGDKPDLSDLAVYGVLSSIEGCDAFKDLLKHSKIAAWYENMKYEIENHSGAVSV